MCAIRLPIRRVELGGIRQAGVRGWRRGRETGVVVLEELDLRAQVLVCYGEDMLAGDTDKQY